jgi:CheY-like chemotaxis protein
MTVPILVAEDDLTLRFLTRRQLTKLGFECDLAIDGKEAFEKASTTKYGLIIMDVQMPNMNGLEATKAIRVLEKSTKEPYTPVIAMTANPDKQSCIDAGMNDFVFKPVRLDDLEKILSRWLPA